jgi:hypothetical protein
MIGSWEDQTGDELRCHWRRSAESRIIENSQLLLYRAASVFLCFPLSSLVPTLLGGIRCDKAGIDGKSFRAHQYSREASLHHRFEDVLQDIALPKPAVAILREACVIRHLAAQSEAAEPAIGEVEMDLLASWYSERIPIE